MTVYELIQELAQFDGDAVVDFEITVDGVSAEIDGIARNVCFDKPQKGRNPFVVQNGNRVAITLEVFD